MEPLLSSPPATSTIDLHWLRQEPPPILLTLYSVPDILTLYTINMSDPFLSNDTRRTGTETKRLHDRKAKWAYGCRRIVHPSVKLGVGFPRPALPATHHLK